MGRLDTLDEGRRLLQQTRGSITIMAALLVSGLMMLLGLSIEASSWMNAKVSIQRTADLAAASGVAAFNAGNSKQTAATYAVNIARTSGIIGATSPTWNGTDTMSSGSISAKYIRGIKTASDTALQVTISQNRGLIFPTLLGSATSVTIAATGTAEIVGMSSTGKAISGLACLLALQSGAPDITLSGGAVIKAANCRVLSDGNITLTGGSTITTDQGTFATGTITPTSAVNGGAYEGQTAVADPFAADSPTLAAIAQLGSGGTAFTASGTQSINPGTYSSMTIHGSSNVTLNPGLYIVNGAIDVDAAMSGTGVTIVTSGVISFKGSGIFNLSAPVAGAASGVPGMLIISTNSGTFTMSGSANMALNGVVYAPNASLNQSGGSSTLPSCLKMVVKNANFSGSANFAGLCSAFTPPGTVQLVQ